MVGSLARFRRQTVYQGGDGWLGRASSLGCEAEHNCDGDACDSCGQLLI
jgi:hypothetical protein